MGYVVDMRQALTMVVSVTDSRGKTMRLGPLGFDSDRKLKENPVECWLFDTRRMGRQLSPSLENWFHADIANIAAEPDFNDQNGNLEYWTGWAHYPVGYASELEWGSATPGYRQVLLELASDEEPDGLSGGLPVRRAAWRTTLASWMRLGGIEV